MHTAVSGENFSGLFLHVILSHSSKMGKIFVHDVMFSPNPRVSSESLVPKDETCDMDHPQIGKRNIYTTVELVGDLSGTMQALVL